MTEAWREQRARNWELERAGSWRRKVGERETLSLHNPTQQVNCTHKKERESKEGRDWFEHVLGPTYTREHNSARTHMQALKPNEGRKNAKNAQIKLNKGRKKRSNQTRDAMR